MKPVRIALLGCGTVGEGVVRLLRSNAAMFERKLGAPLELAGVADRSLKPIPSLGLDAKLITRDSDKLIERDDVDIVVGKAVAGIPAHMKECILKAGCIPAGEELFGIGRIAPAAKRPGQCELEVEQTVFAADRTVTASARRDFCGI